MNGEKKIHRILETGVNPFQDIPGLCGNKNATVHVNKDGIYFLESGLSRGEMHEWSVVEDHVVDVLYILAMKRRAYDCWQEFREAMMGLLDADISVLTNQGPGYTENIKDFSLRETWLTVNSIAGAIHIIDDVVNSCPAPADWPEPDERPAFKNGGES